MGKRNTKATAATSHSLKPKDDAWKVEQIKQLVEAPFPTDSVWEPTEDEIERLQLHISDSGERDQHVIELESKLNPIYDMVPHVLHHCWSHNFYNKNEDVSATTQSKYEERYNALQKQHDVSQNLLRIRYPRLHQYAESQGWNKGIEFNSIRSRLSQDVANTTGKNWLEKMHALLVDKIARSKANNVKLGDDGDIVESPNDPDSSVDDDDDDEVVEVDWSNLTNLPRRGKGEVGSDNVETPSESVSTSKAVTSKTVSSMTDNGRKRSSTSSASPYAAAAKRPKCGTSSDDVGMSNADIDAIAKELDDVQSSIRGKRDNVNKIFSCMARSTTLLKLECNALVGHVDEAHRSVIDLKDHRALAEENRKEYIRTHARSYRAIYESYLKTRRMLYSVMFWNVSGGFARKGREERRNAVMQYYGGTHPFCTSVRGHLQPSDPNATVLESLLLTKEETDRHMTDLLTELHASPHTGGVEGISLLRLPSRVQAQISSVGSWPSDGIGDRDFPSDLVDVVNKTNASMDMAYGVASILDDHYKFLLDDAATPDNGVETPGTDEGEEDEGV